MFALAPLFFLAWLNNQAPVTTNTSDPDAAKSENKEKGKKHAISADKSKAMEIMLEHGFLPQLPTIRIPAFVINVQKSSESHFTGVNFLEAKKPVLLHFWATWCGPCKRELPHFAVFMQSQDTIDAYTITLELKSSDTAIADKIWNFYSTNNIKGLNVCSDINGKLASLFDISGIPATILISSDGHLLGRFLGATDWASPDLAAALSTYLN